MGGTLRRQGIDWLTPAKVSKVSNLGLFCMRATKILTVWTSGNSGFLITDTQTLVNFIIRFGHSSAQTGCIGNESMGPCISLILGNPFKNN